MIHVIIGDGNGKTTSAVGASVRAAGHGWKVLFAQFLKGDSSGEIISLKSLGVSVLQPAVNHGFIFAMDENEKMETAKMCAGLLATAAESDAQLMVLDEVLHTLAAEMIQREAIEKVLDKHCEIILTGGIAPDWLIERADYVSYVSKIKHPYNNGIGARQGIEY